MDEQRNAFLVKALEQEGKPYVWGTKGPNTFDCSGLVTFCLYETSEHRLHWRMSHNAELLWKGLPHTPKPVAGDLIFYGHGDYATHVMILMPDGRPYGASGGNSATTSPEIAKAIGAKVQYRSKVTYRPDLLGYAANPLRIPKAPLS